MNSLNLILPAFAPPVALGSHTVGHEVSTLHGNVQGVALTLRSSRLVNSRRAGIAGTTEILLRAFSPARVSFSIELTPAPSPPGPDTVVTGDPTFDARVSTRSDNRAAAMAWLAAPQLRASLPAIVQELDRLVVSYAVGETTLRLDKPIFEERQLDLVLGLAVGAAHARL